MSHPRSNPIDIPHRKGAETLTVTADVSSGKRTVKYTPSPTSMGASSLSVRGTSSHGRVNKRISTRLSSAPSEVTILIQDDDDTTTHENPLHVQEKFNGRDAKRPLSEDTPLIPNKNDEPKQKEGWISWTRNMGYYMASSAGTWLKESAVDKLTHPFSSIVGLAASLTTAVNAATNASHSDAKDISYTWFKHMPKSIRVESVISFISSLWVNYPANKKFIEDAWGKLKNDTKDFFKSPGHFFNNFFSFVVGLDSGAAAAILAISAFIWIVWGGLTIPSLFAGLGFVINSTSRYLGFKRTLRQIEINFNDDAKVQKQGNDEINHINQDERLNLSELDLLELGILDSKLADAERSIMEILQAVTDAEAERKLASKPLNTDKKLNDQDYEDLYKNLYLALNKLQELHPDNILFNKKNKREYIAEYVALIFRLAIALACLVSAGGIFMQKGWDAYSFVLKKITGNDGEDYNIWLKRLIGLPAGMGSGSLYGVSAYEFFKLFFNDVPTYLWHHPIHFISLYFLLSVNYFASSSMQSIANNVLSHPNNILGALSESPIKEAVPYAARAGAFFVNSLSEFKRYQKNIADPNHPKVEELLKHFEDPNIHLINHTTAVEMSVALNKSSFFTKASDSPSAQASENLCQSNQNNYSYAQVGT